MICPHTAFLNRRKSTIWDHKWILQKISFKHFYTFIDITPIPLKNDGTEQVESFFCGVVYIGMTILTILWRKSEQNRIFSIKNQKKKTHFSQAWHSTYDLSSCFMLVFPQDCQRVSVRCLVLSQCFYKCFQSQPVTIHESDVLKWRVFFYKTDEQSLLIIVWQFNGIWSSLEIVCFLFISWINRGSVWNISQFFCCWGSAKNTNK